MVASKMKLIIVSCLFVLLNPYIGKARMIDSTIEEREMPEGVEQRNQEQG